MKPPDSQTRAAATMLAAVVGYSLLPLLVDLSGEWESLALVTGAWTLAHSSVNAAAVHRWGQQDRSGIPTWQLLRRIPWWAFATAFVAVFQWVLFAWSSRLTETAVTTVIFEFWPILFLVGRGLMPHTAGKKTVTAGDMLLVATAAVALSLVVFSNGSASGVSTGRGVVLAFAALVIAAGERIAHIASGEIVVSKAAGSELSRMSPAALARARTRVGAAQNVVARGVASVVLLAVGATQAIGGGDGALGAIMLGLGMGVLHAVSGLAFTFANHLSRSDTINSLYFLVPALALVWLWALTDVQVANAALFAAGGIGVVAVNTVIHLDPDGASRGNGAESSSSSHAFRALVLTLWGAGAFVVLRDDWLPAGMLRWDASAYWAMLAAVTTVFVFILSFRQTRLSNRESESDRLVLHSLASIEMLRDEAAVSAPTAEELIGHLDRIDQGKDAASIGRGYLDFRETLLAEQGNESHSQRRRLLLDVEVLTSLRQHGREVTETVVIALFAALVGFVALFFRPGAHGERLAEWEGFGTEVVVMCLAAAVAFLQFDLVDRHRLRDLPLLRSTSSEAAVGGEQIRGWRLNLAIGRTQANTAASRAVSTTLGAFVLGAFVLLLRFKWERLAAVP